MNHNATIAYVLNKGSNLSPVICTEEEQKVANTIIQWLGSPCGQGFLEGVLNEIKK